MARAARLSGADLDEDEFEEIEELIHEKQTHPDDLVGCITQTFVKLFSCMYLNRKVKVGND